MRKKMRRVDPEYALEIGAAALAFMAEDVDRLLRFMQLTGLSPSELRTQSQSPALLGAVLDHLLGDESMLLVFTASSAVPPEHVSPARDVLQGTSPR